MEPMHRYALMWSVAVIALATWWSGVRFGVEVLGVSMVAWANMFAHKTARAPQEGSERRAARTCRIFCVY